MLITTSKESVYTTGATREYTEVTGRITKWRAEECLNGLTVEDTRDSMWMIKKKVRVLSTGPMDVNTRVRGSTESKTA